MVGILDSAKLNKVLAVAAIWPPNPTYVTFRFDGVKENALKRVIYIEGHLAGIRNMSNEDKTAWMY